MERVREILRLKEENYSQRKVSQLTGIPRSSVQNYFVKADAIGLKYLEAKELTDEELRESFGKKIPGRERAEIKDPDFSLLHKERMSRKGVTLELLYNEWKAETKAVYSYNTFCRRYQEWGTLQINGSTKFYVSDLDSTNGTMVGNKRLDPRAETVLTERDRIMIAGFILKIDSVPEDLIFTTDPEPQTVIASAEPKATEGKITNAFV